MYVVIGATGHTGHETANKLLANGKKVRVVGRNLDHLKPLVAKGAEPFVANVAEKDSIAKAFAGAKAVYVMFPPDEKAQDYLARADEMAEAFAVAIQKNGVKHAVVLSSVGADKAEGTGPIVGLHHLEERLNRISGLNTLYLRAAYFMENTLGQADAIAQMGSVVGPLQAELKFPCIAARDIGDFAGNALARLDFAGHQVQELHGQRDISYGEITSVIGKAIAKPDLKYAQLTPEQFRDVLVQMGMSRNVAGGLAEMAQGMNSGHVKALEPRSPRNTTPTSYEQFVAETFLPLYQSKRKAA
ncbi:MAG TPA: NAD(P)H-binding protein [Terriglobales bacterium]|nr:NAD(P)H-binding protein [Terriglobales bacterium]